MGAQVITLGCRLNIAESEEIRSLLAREDDLVVINSCAVTSEAVRHTRQAIRRARRDHPEARLLVTGCAAETEREALAAMPEVDGLVPNAEKRDPRRWNVAPERVLAPEHTRAFIEIQNGCDHSCTFCIIPQGRGTSRSRPIDAVVADIERHLDRGAAEIVLTGVDVTSWGHDLPDTPPLGALVQAILDRLPQVRRLRLSSVDGIELDGLLLDLLAHEPRMMPHVHLSLQHGDDLILKRMKRRHLRHDALNLAEWLKARRPEIAFGADLIAGFPTESGEAHAANLSIIPEIGIVHGHIFPFSPRHGTPAARMPQVDKPTIKQRAKALRGEVARVRREWLQSRVGVAQDVLVEKGGVGHAPDFAPFRVGDAPSPGDVIRITPEGIEEGMLV
ncbi:MiaB/RimO family radical SAM methylthiotransferase [Pseudoblastomonas halimionae]|uniref:MiaB/RimO family radical SAM methylthiotransferase n=1 Tax=Alteriqipengyuania halimionae TaxID=1926630 RepID=A0A6I4U404_9SPHN|nr:MiaB/RimO family radical SAM methylthiotransferase [Alteriqipengyuania halimionae]MXP09181.1 MiaB/RimO family radical SAM methylthiotransferase [Alteriqipengyuania halimionae]